MIFERSATPEPADAAFDINAFDEEERRELAEYIRQMVTDILLFLKSLLIMHSAPSPRSRKNLPRSSERTSSESVLRTRWKLFP